MNAFNVVRFKVKAGMENDFLAAHRGIGQTWPGLLHANMIKIGDDRYCLVAEWEDMEALQAARSQMISTLNTFRHTIEDLGNGIGVTDAASGPVVMTMK